MSTLEAIKYENGKLKILDQLKLPLISEYVEINNVGDAWKAIKNMNVRGAPAIAIVGCLGLAVELTTDFKGLQKMPSNEELTSVIFQKLDYLVTSRPTAVNLSKACVELKIEIAKWINEENLIDKIVAWIENLLRNDLDDNYNIGDNGAKEIIETATTSKKGKGKINILTCCNTGSLATSGYGTALGVVRSLHKGGHLEKVYFTETRPYNQGIRLTSYELIHENIPATLICDNMVGICMRNKTLSAVVVGADRVAANGDTANKIGTYQIAILAKYHDVPFYVAAPFTSIDSKTATGNDIVIEERSSDEMLKCSCSFKSTIAPPQTNCWNPAFDVTPGSLITGIITEKGVIKPPYNFNN